jgi:branched-chain amino acid transport system substrate-binding protein
VIDRQLTRRGLAIAAIAAIVLTGCGSRRSQADLLAGAGPGPFHSSASDNARAGGDQAASGSPGDTSADVSSSHATNQSGGGGAGGDGARGSARSDGATVNPVGARRPPGEKSPISIGTLGAWSGVVGQSQGPYLAGLRAWIRSANDRGGLDGHPINQLIVADDGGDSARNRQLAQQLIEQDHVVALLFDGALDASGTVPYVTQQGVPFIGGIGTGDYFYKSPVYFPQAAQGAALAETGVGLMQQAASQGKRKIGVIACIESPTTCNAAISVATKGAPRYGAEVVYTTKASITAPDFSAECLDARNSGAEVIFMAMDGASIERIEQSCTRQGYHPLYATSSVVATPELPKDDNLQGMLLVAPTMPAAAKQDALQEFLGAMARYAPKEDLVDGQVEAWAAGKILELGSKNLPDGDVSALRKAVLNGLWAIPSGTDLGITAPLQYNSNRPATRTVCWFMESIQNHRYVSDGKRTCIPYDPDLA